MKYQIFIGEKINNLEILDEFKEIVNGKTIFMLECKCDCGNIKKIRKANVVSGKTKSCGCLTIKKLKERATTHGLSSDKKFIDSFHSAKKRTLKDINYINKGVKFKLGTIQEFIKEMYSSYLLHLKEYGINNTSLDRIDNNGNYEYGNIRWATRLIQNNNQGIRKDQKAFVININGVEKKYYNKTKCAKDIGESTTFICDCIKRGHKPIKRKDILYIKYI